MAGLEQESGSDTLSLLTQALTDRASGCHTSQDRARQGSVSKHIFHTIPVLRKHPMQLAMITKFIINCVFHDVSDNMLM